MLKMLVNNICDHYFCIQELELIMRNAWQLCLKLTAVCGRCIMASIYIPRQDRSIHFVDILLCVMR